VKKAISCRLSVFFRSEKGWHTDDADAADNRR